MATNYKIPILDITVSFCQQFFMLWVTIGELVKLFPSHMVSASDIGLINIASKLARFEGLVLL